MERWFEREEPQSLPSLLHFGSQPDVGAVVILEARIKATPRAISGCTICSLEGLRRIHFVGWLQGFGHQNGHNNRRDTAVSPHTSRINSSASDPAVT